MAENFPNLKSKMDIQVQESERVLNEMNPERSTLIYTLFKFIKVKDKRILKTVKGKKPSLHSRETSQGFWQIFHQKLYRPGDSGMTYSQ